MRRASAPSVRAPGRQPIQRSRSAHDGALHTLGRDIVTGAYPAESLLPSKDRLMQRLAVSHTTLREALQTLSAKGMIAAKARVGTRVLDESRWNLFDADILAWRLDAGIGPAFLAMLFEIRQALEPVAAALAASRRHAADIEQLQALTEAFRTHARDRARFVDVDVAFHQRVLDASGNPFMQSISALISTALSASFTLSAPIDKPDLADLAYHQHAAVCRAIASGDPQAASEAMVAVIRQGWMTYAGLDAVDIATLHIAAFSDRPSGHG